MCWTKCKHWGKANLKIEGQKERDSQPASISFVYVSRDTQAPSYLCSCPIEALKIWPPLATLKFRGIRTTYIIRSYTGKFYSPLNMFFSYQLEIPYQLQNSCASQCPEAKCKELRQCLSAKFGSENITRTDRLLWWNSCSICQDTHTSTKYLQMLTIKLDTHELGTPISSLTSKQMSNNTYITKLKQYLTSNNCANFKLQPVIINLCNALLLEGHVLIPLKWSDGISLRLVSYDDPKWNLKV